MSRASFLRFSNIITNTGITQAMRVAAFGVVCFGLSACVEGVDLPNFVISLQEAGARSIQADAQEPVEHKVEAVRELKPSPRYVREPTDVNSKALLEARGNWNLVEQGGAMDPTQAHMKAREAVNVRRRGAKKELSAHFQPDAKSGEDGKMRVLRMERDGQSNGSDTTSIYDLAESSVSKPSHTVAESDLMKKIKALFGEEDDASRSINEVSKSRPVEKEVAQVSKASGIITPSRKPNQGSLIEAVSNQDVTHMVGGVVVPPALPVGKRAAVTRIVWNQGKSAAIGGVVVPRVKPRTKAEDIVQAKPDTPMLGRAEAVKIRSGKHQGKTRLVVEVSKPTEYKVVIDHVRNTLRVKLENTHWAMAVQDSFDKSTLLGTYIAREQSDGSVMFEVRLKKQSKIIDTMLLRPNLSSQHRLVIDLKD
jgi:hypothetical protein